VEGKSTFSGLRERIVKQPEIEKTLENCEFFKGFETEAIKSVAKICQVRTYDIGETVFQQGDFGEHLYIIVEGLVYLERTMNIGTHKGKAVIATLGKGRVLGCWSTLLNEPHILMSSANCQRATTALELGGAELRRMMTDNTDFGFNVLERLCFLLRDRVQSAIGALDKI
jgi:CRP-like cAMP-binding protein